MTYTKQYLLVFVLAYGNICYQVSCFAPSSPSIKSRTASFLERPSSTRLNYASGRTFNDDIAVDRHRSNGEHENPHEKKYTLNSKNISELKASSSTYDDVEAALRRARNLHDSRDLRAVGAFLLDGTPDSFAYGYKSPLLAKLAVVALRLGEVDVAKRAITVRRERFSESMTPFESAAIVRGLLRLQRSEDAFDLLEEELSMDSLHAENPDRIKHRASALSSIASRYFFEHQPAVAIRACRMLAEVGVVIKQSHSELLTAEELEMPWYRILAGADECQVAHPSKCEDIDEAVVGAMSAFPLTAKMEAILRK
eukprot:CAMPEP_0113537496 /NCGR_PEP_ID=MMETSP0015_2-20120614/6858_1 /TAXON_ID=2838 /ORGANISM="Odontella" /LENGTH=310 /DNA_ID=CAMNT_0000436997 /DNA_START=34 /DNA_END=966 /DNA_ORIENTATION=+ /assembly_acc=CAM_ASM_000160